ncbi:MAG: hypothetical protein C0622_13780 [Desulfuromonas sp.]|nr:MAG: hypothetical protein C0622_13780 [Desulfuromonas sp.]
MSRLIVTAVGTNVLATTDNSDVCYVSVSVTDAYGNPVTGLEKSDFEVGTMLVAPGGTALVLAAVRPSVLPGFYAFDMRPHGYELWMKGKYVVAIAVQKEKKKGQALVTIQID